MERCPSPALLFLACWFATGCSSPASSQQPSANPSFMNDVIPIFQSQCGRTGGPCHGTTTDPDPTIMTQPRPFLGPEFGVVSQATAMTIYNGIVGVPSNEAPTVDYVSRTGSLSASYLWLKISSNAAQLNGMVSICTGGIASPACGAPMPNNLASLPTAQLTTIENWIKENAPFN